MSDVLASYFLDIYVYYDMTSSSNSLIVYWMDWADVRAKVAAFQVFARKYDISLDLPGFGVRNGDATEQW